MGFAHRMQIEVAWGDQDAYQHVNNVQFARYAESARVRYFVDLQLMNPEAMPVLVSLKLDWAKSVLFPQTLSVESSVTRIGRTSFTMQQEMRDELGDLCCSTEATGVVVAGLGGRPTPVPDDYRQRITEFEAKAGRTVA